MEQNDAEDSSNATSDRREEARVSLTWSHFTEDVEGLGGLGLDRVDAVGSLPLYKQVVTVSGQSCKDEDPGHAAEGFICLLLNFY